MQPDYKVSIAITALLIVVALLIPPWKDQFNGEFVDFYYIFSEEIPKIKWIDNSPIRVNLEIDYARLVIEIIGIILMLLAAHLLMLVNIWLFIRRHNYLILFISVALLLLYFGEFGQMENMIVLSVVMITLLFSLMSGDIRLRSGIKRLDAEVGKGNLGDYANLIKIILIGLAALVGLLSDYLSNL